MSRKSWDERLRQIRELLLVANDLLEGLEEDMKSYSLKRKGGDRNGDGSN